MELREVYYELYSDGNYEQTYSRYADAEEASLHYLDDDCVEIYKIELYEEKVM